ncbi:MAG: thioredoxin [Bradymonadia bacterium]
MQSSPQTPFVYDVSEAEFEEKVIKRSLEVPVVVDFWAPWCGPCKQLGPILEELTAEWGGALELAKVNIDEAPMLAQMLRIQSIPTVYAFKGGQPIDGFMGAQPRPQLKAFFERLAPAPERDPMEVAEEALAAGDLLTAEQGFQKALSQDPNNGYAAVGMARVCLARKDTTTAGNWLDQIDETSPAFLAATNLKGVMAFADEVGNETELRAAVEANPKDAAAWYSLGATLATANRMEEAMAAFLNVVKADRQYKEDGGRKALLALFNLIGQDDPAVISARRKLGALLF